MQIIAPKVTLVDPLDGDEILRKIERAGRTCYKSESGDVAKTEQFIRNIIKRGHESVLEHVSVTFEIVCDRAIANELVRHRLASYSQESTRYVKYDNLEFIEPLGITEKQGTVLGLALNEAETNYKNMLARGASPQIARAVLPLCLATTLTMTANMREWRHILKLRTAQDAHPDMQFIATQILQILKEYTPVIFEDIPKGRSQ